MQPRILVRQQGQQKKRFISPNQIKNNQAIYGDPLVSQKYPMQNQPLVPNRMYSPQHQQITGNNDNLARGKPINDRNYIEEQKNIVNQNNLERQHFQQQQKQRKNIHASSKIEANSVNRQSSSKSQSGKKDYMMAGLARFQKKPLGKNQDQSSNASQSRSKVQSIKNQKIKKSNINEQYSKKNVYNQKQKVVKRRPRNGSRASSKSSKNSKNSSKDHIQNEERSQIVYEQKLIQNRSNFNEANIKREQMLKNNTNFQDNNKKVPNISNFPNQRQNFDSKIAKKSSFQQNVGQKLQFHQPKDKQKLFSFKDTVQNYAKNNIVQYGTNYNQYQGSQMSSNSSIPQRFQQPRQLQKQNHFQSSQSSQHHQSPRNINNINNPSQPFKQQKVSFTLPPQQRKLQQQNNNHYPNNNHQASNDPTNSSLAIHLKNAHQQKQQLRSKKILMQKQCHQYKQKTQELQHTINRMRKQLQQLRIQKLSLNSQLKSIRQYQQQTKNQLKDTNDKNEHIYREIHVKFQKLLNEHKQITQHNDSLIQENEKMKMQMLNLQKKLNFYETKCNQQQKQYIALQEEYRIQVRETIQQWRNKVELLQKQLRRHQSSQFQTNSGTHTGNIKIKLIEQETQMKHKAQLLNKRQQEIKSLKKQFGQRIANLQQSCLQKQRQLKELREDNIKSQRTFGQRVRQYEQNMKNIQLILAKTQKQLQYKKLQLQETKKSISKQIQVNNVTSIYPVDAKYSVQTLQAKSSLEGLVTTQTKQVNDYKKQLNRYIQENFQLKNQIEEERSKLNNLEQDLKILQLQYSSLQKKSQQSSSTQTIVIKNQLQLSNRKQKQLQQRLEWKSKQIKQKDQFIQTQLLRVTKQQNVPMLLDRLKEIAEMIAAGGSGCSGGSGVRAGK